jgi:hypothetical protein
MRRNNPEDSHPHTRRRENLKSHCSELPHDDMRCCVMLGLFKGIRSIVLIMVRRRKITVVLNYELGGCEKKQL